MNNMTYRDWLKAVDRLTTVIFSLRERDLDWPNRATYDTGATPQEGYQVWIKHLGSNSVGSRS